jgi:hypothetical protein
MMTQAVDRSTPAMIPVLPVIQAAAVSVLSAWVCF